MANWGISELTVRPARAVVLRYGLAVILVAIALAITVITHLHNSPPRFVSHFVLLAIAITFWCAGTGPGLLALLLSCLGVSFLATNHFLTADFPLGPFLGFFVVFSFLMSLFSASRRRAQKLLIEARDSLELRVTERTAELVRANKELQNTQAELRLIIDSIPGLVRTNSATGELQLVNRQFLEYLGKTLEELNRRAASDLVHPDDLPWLGAAWKHAIETGNFDDTEYRMLRADGIYRWFQHRSLPLRDIQGRITRWYTLATDIEDRKQAEDKLRKAFEEIKELRDQLHQENLALKEEIDQASMFEEIVGCSDALRRVLMQVEKVAPTDSTVLITGETGTGKELIARAIHKRSKRAGQAFISVNCASIPTSLIASELFGHEKGAFTGALQRRQGRFELANGGTLFLDEVGELPAETQIALLRVLQERQFERVGGNRVLETDVRVIAATNRDLTAAIGAGAFRADLFYRLNVFPIEVPALRQRTDDIPVLVEYFVKRYAQKAGKRIKNIRKKTLELFQMYDWPGNVRELQNVVERAVVLSDDDTFLVPESWLKPALQGQPQGVPVDRSLTSVPLVTNLIEREKEIIETALREAEGVVGGPAGAAVKLGILRETLNSKIRKLGIKRYLFKRS
jgi:formate hydrogenlyase transcriptional activator